MAQGSIIWRCRTCGNKTRSICRHPRAGYSIIYLVGKRQRWEAVGRNKKDAERRLGEVMSQVHQGTYQELQHVTFAEFAERWLNDYAARRVKPLTLRFYRGLINIQLNPAFGNLFLTDITSYRIEQFLTSVICEKGLSTYRANHLLVVLKAMLRHACRWSLLRQNPAADIKRMQHEPKEMDFLTPEEIRLFLQHADEPYKTLFLTAILTGMRRGELLALQWGDIDWQSNLIYVRRSIFWYNLKELKELGREGKPAWQFVSPKSKRSVRTIFLSPRLREVLESHRLTCPVSPHDLVFSDTEGNPVDPRNLAWREFQPALSRAGLRHIRFHDLRHTFTALLIAQGENIKFIQSQLGHTSITTTLDRYGHLLPEVQHGAGERLDAMVFDAANTEKATKGIPVTVLSEIVSLS